ncbi:Ldh family oxidoreductase [Vibrio sp. Of14-4]|uniref:Ldh family oxidoreductase n=1 Tax=Vibrio sp. Of14-4 TaxID=2724878 RepID=UPI001EF204B6|nr:Ldh family oxidoreductase [Vibrio sp. Of14-4]MCG7490559.1 Ldh family oxidoreductase [Vibrio sp. Of14-4]
MEISVQNIESYISEGLMSLGLGREDALLATRAMVQSTQWGVDTHGIRLFPTYVKELVGGRVRSSQRFKVDRLSSSLSRLDAQQSLGFLAGFKAAELARELALDSGCGVVCVTNSNHFGAAQLYGRWLAEHDFLGIVMTNAAPRVVPFGGLDQLFGTNPICFTAPSTKQPFCLDMATSQISYSKVKGMFRNGEQPPKEWAIDAQGEACQSIEALKGLLPLGGYKGQGLAMMVEIMCSVLTGSTLGLKMSHLDREPFDKKRDVSHFVLALDPGRFMPIEEFKQNLTAYMDSVRNSSPQSGKEILVAGDKELATEKKRIQALPLSQGELEDFLSVEHHFDPARTINELVRS